MPPRLQAIVCGPRKHLWPDGRENKKVILYPDMFRDDFGLDEQHSVADAEPEEERRDSAESSRAANEISNSVALASAMGAIVTPHLHSGVTHVLCHLPGGRDWMMWEPGLREDSDGSGLGEQLLRKMKDVHPSGHVVLLTPAYLNRNFPSLGE
jgi:hypothetical protein